MHAAEAAAFAAPTPGVSAAQRWLQKGNLAAQHAAAGAFDSAMRLLNRRAHAFLAAPLCSASGRAAVLLCLCEKPLRSGSTCRIMFAVGHAGIPQGSLFLLHLY